MPMGLTNACATFQRLIDKVLERLIGKIFFVYLDDIIIFSKDLESHVQHVKTIADRLRKHSLKLKLEKCKLALEEIEYLSHIISPGRFHNRRARFKLYIVLKLQLTFNRSRVFWVWLHTIAASSKVLPELLPHLFS